MHNPRAGNEAFDHRPAEANVATETEDSRDPFLFDLPERERELLSADFLCNGRTSQGLGIAYLLQGLGVSLLTDPGWDTALVQLRIDFLDESDGISTRTEDVLHASRQAHILQHLSALAARRKAEVYDPIDLWRSKAQIFPALRFCESVELDIQKIGRGALFNRLVRKLSELNDYCAKWNEGPFNRVGLSGDPREDSTETLRQYSDERTFACPDGKTRVFSWHLSLSPWGRRMYFHPDSEERSVCIGYVGPHLRTVKFH